MSFRGRAARQRKETSKRLPVNRFDAVREVACEAVGVAYGAVVAEGGKVVTCELSDDGNSTIQRVVTDLRISYEMNESGDASGFLRRSALRTAHAEGFRSRTAQRELGRSVGELQGDDSERPR